MCGVSERGEGELSRTEIQKILRNFGSSLYWLTFSGGEPFLREDFEAICIEAQDLLRPRFITIPTNGVLSDTIRTVVRAILARGRKTQIIVNLSLDGIGPDHDAIRGRQGSFQDALRTYKALRSLDDARLTVGIHTVITRYNAHAFPALLKYSIGLDPDSYIIEYAQKKGELYNAQKDFLATPEEYEQCLDILLAASSAARKNRVSKYIRVLRKRYYELSRSMVRTRESPLPCYAGFSSAQISAEGIVWACGSACRPLGNLRDTDYSFRKVWLSETARTVREEIKRHKCFCVSANMHYQNMLLHFPSLCRLVKDYIFS